MKKYKFRGLVIGILFLIIFYFNSHLGLLCFFVFFQAMLIIEIVKDIKIFRKLRNGIFKEGVLISFRKIKGYEEEAHNYEGVLEFYWPNESIKYQIKHKLTSLQMPVVFKKYLIWIDTNDPLNSIVVNKFNINWKLRIIFFIIIFIGLFYIDIIHLSSIFN